MNNRYGEEYKGDSPFVAKCRKLQSIYREEIGEKIAPYTDRYGNVHYYGNYIENGDIPKESGDGWKNFLTECAFKHAKYRVENKKEYETYQYIQRCDGRRSCLEHGFLRGLPQPSYRRQLQRR